MDLTIRPRRLRTSAKLRKMVRETRMDKSSLVYPMFVMDGENKKEEIPTMPGQFRYTLDRMPEILQEMADAGVGSVMLFGIPDHKDEVGSGAYACDGIIQRALEKAKKEVPDLYYIGDVCMCEYTSHGHCGILKGDYVDNDLTLDKLAQIAVSQVQAGADMSYQMDYNNRREGIKEAMLDIEEGADIIMVKPAMSYLDMVREIKDLTDVPMAAYSVSGEYAMVKAAAKLGYVDEAAILCEMAASAYRAGVDIYMSYYAKEIAHFMDEGRIG